VAGVTSGGSGSTIALQVSTSGRPCSAGDYPDVRLRLAGGASPVAKQFNYVPAVRAGMSTLEAYVHGGLARPALVVQPGRWVRVVLLAPAVHGSACRLARSAAVYPADVAVGAAKTVALPRPVAVCGVLRVMPFQPGGTVTSAFRLAGQALASVEPDARSHIPANDSPSGWYYGSDGPGGVACGSGPYTEASHDSSSDPCATTNGSYGGYVGEVGTWGKWQSCPGAGQDFNDTSANDATINYAKYGRGVGVNGYWMLGGPGRNPNYDNGSGTQAYDWGEQQAAQAAKWTSNSIYFAGGSAGSYIFMDIELFHGGNPDYNNGWYSHFGSPCQTGDGTPGENTSLNQDVFNGFYDYITNNTPVYVGAYNSGGTSSQYFWPNIMGNKTLSNSGEWTWNDPNSSISTFPSGWSIGGGDSASFFAGAPGRCDLAWQWSGGGGLSNATGRRFDQFDGNNFPASNLSACA
jgi:hypothetical protein